MTVSGTRLERDLADLPGAAPWWTRGKPNRASPACNWTRAWRGCRAFICRTATHFAQGLRLSSRGFGARAPFGVRGLRLNVDGFPETLPDGQSQVDAIDLDALESITVLRGPASVLYATPAAAWWT